MSTYGDTAAMSTFGDIAAVSPNDDTAAGCQITPSASIASATRVKPAMFAPTT
jgi:hypothetical protein